MPEPTPERFLGCLLGGALGDALGYPIEFEQPGSLLVARYGAEPPARLRYKGAGDGVASDDTQMTLFTAEGILRARQAGERDATAAVLRAYQRWYGTQAMRGGEAPRPPQGHGWLVAVPALHARRAPGATCLGALAQSLMGKPTPSVEEPPNHSKGCGAVMRSAPFGLASPTRDEAFRAARDAGVLTHGHPSGYLSAAYFAALIFDVARGAPLGEAMRAADALLANERGADEMQAIITKTLRLAAKGPPGPEAIEALGGGWTGEEALAIALVCALTADAETTDGFALALWRAVLHGGDSDSTGSLAGNLLGAMHGDGVLPAAWLDDLDLRDVVARMARDLHAAAILGQEIDRDAYPPG